MTTLREAAQQALEALEALQGGCTDSNDGTVEAITVWCPEIIDALRAALAEPVQEPAQVVPREWRNALREVALTLNGVVWIITQTNNKFCLEAKDCFVEGMTDQTKIIGGLTIATARRAELNSLFEKWLEKTIQTKLVEKNT